MGVCSINLSITICIGDVEDGRCDCDVVSHLEIVPTLDGERCVIRIRCSVLHIHGVTGVGTEAEAQLVAVNEGVIPVQTNHPALHFFSGAVVVGIREAVVKASADGGDDARLFRSPVTTKTEGMKAFIKFLGSGGGVTHGRRGAVAAVLVGIEARDVPLTVAVADLAQEEPVGVITEHALTIAGLGTFATVSHVVSSDVEGCFTRIDVLTPLDTKTLTGTGTHHSAVSAQFQSLEEGFVTGRCFDHVVVLNQGTNSDLEAVTHGEGVPELVNLEDVVTGLGVGQEVVLIASSKGIIHVARTDTGVQEILASEG